MSHPSIVALARRRHPPEGQGSRADQPPRRRLVLLASLALTGAALGFLGGQALARFVPHAERLRPGEALLTGRASIAASWRGNGQGGEGLRCSGTAAPGSTLQVEVASNDDSVAITNPLTGATTQHSVGPDKTANLPIPQVPPGTVLRITVGRGANERSVTVEVVAPAP